MRDLIDADEPQIENALKQVHNQKSFFHDLLSDNTWSGRLADVSRLTI